jgi:hypothetical protein
MTDQPLTQAEIDAETAKVPAKPTDAYVKKLIKDLNDTAGA